MTSNRITSTGFGAFLNLLPAVSSPCTHGTICTLYNKIIKHQQNLQKKTLRELKVRRIIQYKLIFNQQIPNCFKISKVHRLCTPLHSQETNLQNQVIQQIRFEYTYVYEFYLFPRIFLSEIILSFAWKILLPEFVFFEITISIETESSTPLKWKPTTTTILTTSIHLPSSEKSHVLQPPSTSFQNCHTVSPTRPLYNHKLQDHLLSPTNIWRSFSIRNLKMRYAVEMHKIKAW